jgi:hypothetical protein
MIIARIIMKLRDRHSRQIANRTCSHRLTARGAAPGSAGRGAPTMHRTAVMTAVAMLISVSAYAARHKTLDEPYVGTFATIAADDKFREHYDEWRRNFPDFDWHNNGCSGPAKLTGYADNFFWPCVQHDFGYRNAPLVNRRNEATRKFIDDELLKHTKQVCSHYHVLKKPSCYVTANNFYNAVRLFARGYFF